VVLCLNQALVIEVFTQIPMGDVRVFLCPDVMEVLTGLELSRVTLPSALKVVAHTWDKLPDHSSVVKEVLTVLAKASHAVWPSWYGQENVFSGVEATLEQGIFNQLQCQALKARQPEICEPWVKAAVNACESGQIPLPNKFAHALQLSQLALTLDPVTLIFILAVNDAQPEPWRLFGFARAATWIAQETGSRVAVLMPAHLTDCEELASILYGAVELSPALPSRSTETISGEEAKHFLWPLQGQPHPGSPGEQKLADRLSRDQELAILFGFNQSIRTVRGSLYLVDLLWLEGKVIVEIDGYRYHGNRFAFGEDRNRDYELLISDYVVLRLPHDEVVADIEIAIEKIRDVVRFRRSQKLNKSEV